MESLEMIKCYLARDPQEKGTVRFVPLEIYEMWRFLMERVHHFTVQEPRVAYWVTKEYYDDLPLEEKRYHAEPVTEIRFKYMESNDMGKPISRYFPDENFDEIYGYFSKNFPDESRMEGIHRRAGYYMEGKSVTYIARR